MLHYLSRLLLLGSLSNFLVEKEQSWIMFLLGNGGVVSDPRSSGEFNKNRESARKPTNPRTDTRNWRVQNPHISRAPPNDRNAEPKRNHEGTLMKQAPPKPSRPSVDDSGPGRPKAPSIDSAPGRSKPCVKPKVDNEIKFQQKSENRPIQKKPMPPQQEVHITICKLFNICRSIYLPIRAIYFVSHLTALVLFLPEAESQE